jgi:putative copper resistance protein D
VNDLLVCARAIHFAATLAVAGVVFFTVFVTGSSLRMVKDETNIAALMRSRLAWIAWLGLIVAILSGAAWLVVNMQMMSGAALADVVAKDLLWTVLSQTTFGHDWLVRVVLTCLLAGAFVVFWSTWQQPSVWLDAVTVMLAASFAGSLAWAGHAAGGLRSEGFIHPTADVLHLVAAAAWIGGLIPLALLLAAAQNDTASLATTRQATLRFSTLGIVSVGTLLITGSINTWYLAGSVSALTGTDYGQLLVVKIALFLAMAAIAMVNRLRLTPRLAPQAIGVGGCGTLRQLRRNSLIEFLAGTIIIIIVAILGTMPPGLHQMPASGGTHNHTHEN